MFTNCSDAMQELHDDIIKTVGMLTNNAVSKADDAMKTAHRLGEQLMFMINYLFILLCTSIQYARTCMYLN